MDVSTMAIGSITRCMDEVCLRGLMAVATRASTLTIASKARAYSHGLMEDDMKVAGSTENNMALVSIIHPRERPRKENGMRANVFDG